MVWLVWQQYMTVKMCSTIKHYHLIINMYKVYTLQHSVLGKSISTRICQSQTAILEPSQSHSFPANSQLWPDWSPRRCSSQKDLWGSGKLPHSISYAYTCSSTTIQYQYALWNVVIAQWCSREEPCIVHGRGTYHAEQLAHSQVHQLSGQSVVPSLPVEQRHNLWLSLALSETTSVWPSEVVTVWAYCVLGFNMITWT